MNLRSLPQPCPGRNVLFICVIYVCYLYGKVVDRLDLIQRLVQVGNQVSGVFHPQRQPHQVVLYA